MPIDKRRKAVLILECDSDTLSQQGLGLGKELFEVLRNTFPKNPLRLIRSRSLAGLLKSLAETVETGQKYATIIIVGHSSRNQLQISNDASFAWHSVAAFVSPFEPMRLILLACEAGREFPCVRVFENLPRLKEIFASPIFVAKNQIYLVIAKTLHVLGARREDFTLNQVMQVGNFVLTRGIMFHYKRTEFINP